MEAKKGETWRERKPSSSLLFPVVLNSGVARLSVMVGHIIIASSQFQPVVLGIFVKDLVHSVSIIKIIIIIHII